MIKIFREINENWEILKREADSRDREKAVSILESFFERNGFDGAKTKDDRDNFNPFLIFFASEHVAVDVKQGEGVEYIG
jgi:hypothetical protein